MNVSLTVYKRFQISPSEYVPFLERLSAVQYTGFTLTTVSLNRKKEFMKNGVTKYSMTELKYCAYLFPYGQRHLVVTQHILGLDTDIYTHYKDIQLVDIRLMSLTNPHVTRMSNV